MVYKNTEVVEHVNIIGFHCEILNKNIYVLKINVHVSGINDDKCCLKKNHVMMHISVHKKDIMSLNICFPLSFQNLDEGLAPQWENGNL